MTSLVCGNKIIVSVILTIKERMGRKMKPLKLLIVLSFVCSACAHHRDEGRELTVGTVQKEIKRGMSGAEVASVLGSPNIVSTDDDGNEVWVYDKISSSVSASQSYGTLILLGASTAKRDSQQKTLTVIISFDENKRVKDFKYHTSRF